MLRTYTATLKNVLGLGLCCVVPATGKFFYTIYTASRKTTFAAKKGVMSLLVWQQATMLFNVGKNLLSRRVPIQNTICG